MMNIYICVGSSCHLKGSYKIIILMKEHLGRKGLTEKVNLSASFCLGKCTHGVTIKVDDETICGVSIDNFERIFNKHILEQLADTRFNGQKKIEAIEKEKNQVLD